MRLYLTFGEFLLHILQDTIEPGRVFDASCNSNRCLEATARSMSSTRSRGWSNPTDSFDFQSQQPGALQGIERRRQDCIRTVYHKFTIFRPIIKACPLYIYPAKHHALSNGRLAAISTAPHLKPSPSRDTVQQSFRPVRLPAFSDLKPH